MVPPRLILASASPRRVELMRTVGLGFDVMPSGVEEGYPRGSPTEYALAMARAKALEVSRRVGDPTRLVLGADTVVVFEGDVFGKPSDEVDASRMLELLSGRTHSVLTAFCIARAPSALLHEEIVET